MDRINRIKADLFQHFKPCPVDMVIVEPLCGAVPDRFLGLQLPVELSVAYGLGYMLGGYV